MNGMPEAKEGCNLFVSLYIYEWCAGRDLELEFFKTPEYRPAQSGERDTVDIREVLVLWTSPWGRYALIFVKLPGTRRGLLWSRGCVVL